MLYIPHGRTKTCRTQSGSREYLCTCTSDSWSGPGEICAECEQASEEFEDDMPFDFYEWDEMHLDAEEALAADRAKLIALGADPGPTMSEVFGHASDMSEDWLTIGPQADETAHPSLASKDHPQEKNGK